MLITRNTLYMQTTYCVSKAHICNYLLTISKWPAVWKMNPDPLLSFLKCTIPQVKSSTTEWSICYKWFARTNMYILVHSIQSVRIHYWCCISYALEKPFIMKIPSYTSPISWRILPKCSSRNFTIPNFKLIYLIHLELIFVQGNRNSENR